MRLAILDVGSFTARMLVADIDPAGYSVIKDWGAITALGEGLGVGQHLSEEAIRRTLETARGQLLEARTLGVEKSFGIATEAVRRAQNGRRLIQEIQTLVDAVSILSPNEEAHLAFLANRVYFSRVPKLAVVDMGGGSLQIAVGTHLPDATASLPLGVSVLTERFLKSDPPTPDQMEALKDYVRRQLLEVTALVESLHDRMCVILGGTIASLAALDAGLRFFRAQAVEAYHLKSDRLAYWESKLAQMTLAERKAIPLMADRRAEVIPAGVAVLSVFAETFKLPEIVYSGRGIRHGFAIQFQRRTFLEKSAFPEGEKPPDQ